MGMGALNVDAFVSFFVEFPAYVNFYNETHKISELAEAFVTDKDEVNV